MTRGGLALLLAALAAAAPLANAQDAGGYLGAALGQSKLKDWCKTSGTTTFASCEAKDTAWKLLGGYRFNRYVAAELSYINWGQTTASTATARASAEQQSFGLAFVGSLRLAEYFDVFGKVGYLRTGQETSNATSTLERSENEVHFGLGARFAFTRNWAARVEWENTDQLKVEMLSLGAEYRF